MKIKPPKTAKTILDPGVESLNDPKIKDPKKIMIAKNVPIYYKYICPMRRHTRHWPSVIPTDFAHFLKKIPIAQRPIQWARHLATRKNYTIHEYTPL